MELEEAKKVLMSLPQYQERGTEEDEAIDTVMRELVALQNLLDEKREEIQELRQENEVLKFENNRKVVGKPSDYIHKDKIKEKIEEVKSRKSGDVFDLQAFMYEQEAIIEELEELLKGE